MLYLDSCQGVQPENLEGFFEGWQVKPFPKTHLELLQNSDEVILAMDEQTPLPIRLLPIG